MRFINTTAQLKQHAVTTVFRALGIPWLDAVNLLREKKNSNLDKILESFSPDGKRRMQFLIAADQTGAKAKKTAYSELGVKPEDPKADFDKKIKEAKELGAKEFAASIGLSMNPGQSPKEALGLLVARKTASAIAATGHEPLPISNSEEYGDYDSMSLPELRRALQKADSPIVSKEIYNEIQKRQKK